MFCEADVSQIPMRIAEIGGSDEILAWLEGRRLDSELIRFAATVVSAQMLENEPALAEETSRAAAAFLTGFVAAVCLSNEGAITTTFDTAGLLARASALVARRGRHAVIADRCDLSAVAEIEEGVALELLRASSIHGALARRQFFKALVRLFESGLATGLVMTDSARAPEPLRT